MIFPECKAAATGSCRVTYVPEGVNVSLSAHQIFWEQGLMFLAFKTHFLSSWAKWKISVAQHMCWLTPLYCNHLSTFPNSRGLERSKLAGWREWRGVRGEGGAAASRVKVQSMVNAAKDDTSQCTQQWVQKSGFKSTITAPGAPAHGVECSGHQLKPN